MGNKYANVIGVLLTVLIVLVGIAINQSWSAMTDTQELKESVSVHCAENQVKQDYIKQALDEIKNDVKDIKRQLNKGFFK